MLQVKLENSICSFCSNLKLIGECKIFDLKKDLNNVRDCIEFNTNDYKFSTKGSLDIRTIKVGDTLYEYEYNICIKSTVISEPKEVEKNLWKWECKLSNGKLISYSHNVEYPHYSINLYNYEAYKVNQTVE